MTLRERLEKWAKANAAEANPMSLHLNKASRLRSIEDGTSGARDMLDLLWPVIEAAQTHSCQMGEANVHEALTELEMELDGDKSN